MARQKIRQLTPKPMLTLFTVILAIIIALAWLSYHFVKPLPPRTLTMATGMTGGSYAAFGERYRQILARDGVKLTLRPSSGAVENLRLLLDPHENIDAGFIQSIIGQIDETSNLVSLGNLAYTPLWIFYRGKETLDDLQQLKGKRIAVGPEGSGVRKFSLDLLKTAGVSGPSTKFLGLPNADAKAAIIKGDVDAMMVFGSPDNALIMELLHAGNIKLMSLSQAEAYSRIIRDLSHVVLPRGVIDPARRYPPSDVHLLSPTINLIVHKNLHPALVYLLLKAAVEIHSSAGWVHEAGEFPSLRKQDDPISEQAQRFYKSGGSWIYAYLPFWAATFVDRMTLIMISIGMIIVPLIGIAPWLYTWRNRSKYYPLYRELMRLEQDMAENRQTQKISDYEARLDKIETAVSKLRTSVAFYDELFILKEHIQIVRQKQRLLSNRLPETAAE